jgi:hypothetical protein
MRSLDNRRDRRIVPVQESEQLVHAGQSPAALTLR